MAKKEENKSYYKNLFHETVDFWKNRKKKSKGNSFHHSEQSDSSFPGIESIYKNNRK